MPEPAFATCLDFNPWYDMVEVQADESLNLSQITVEAWVRLTRDLNLMSGYAILDKNLPPESNPDPSDSNYLLFIEGELDYLGRPSAHAHAVGFSIGDGVSYGRVYSQTLTPGLEGEWHHISGTYDGSTLRLYIDGELEASVPVSMQAVHNNGLLTLGWSPVGYLLSWNGRLDEIRIWDISRTQADIKQTMHVRMRGTEPGLIAYWNFDEGSGQVAHDLAGIDNSAQLGSSPDPDDQDPDWDVFAAPCDKPLEIVSTSPLPDAKMGENYSFAFDADGGYWAYSWSLVAGSLPGGLSLSEGGVLSGTPTGYGDFSFTVLVTDQGIPIQTDSGAFSLRVLPPDLVLTTTSLPNGAEGVHYEAILQAQGGIPPYRWRLNSSGLPDGLSLNESTGRISGTPTNAAIGTWLFSVVVEDSQSPAASDDQLLSITIAPAADLSITTAYPLPDGKVGVSYGLTFTAEGGKLAYSWSISSGTLPAGMSVSTGGLLSGTPQEYGDFLFTVRASDSQQPPDTATRQYALHIAPADLIIQTASFPSGVEGVLYSQSLEATGGVPPYAWSISAGVLPPGLVLSVSSGAIAGTPTNAAIGTWNFNVRVIDSQSQPYEDDRGFSITVTPAGDLSITSGSTLPDEKVGESYGHSFAASGGKLPYVWDILSGSLPPGLSLSGNGELTGTPSGYGDFTFVVRVRDSQQTPDSDSKEIAVRVLPADLNVLTASLPDGVEGVQYNQTLVASGGISPYTWRLLDGALPQGLMLSSSGTISGIPSNSAIGTSSFTVQVSDSQSQPATDEQTFSITISAAGVLTITTVSPLPDGKIGEAYSFAFAASGGKTPYVWDVISGSVPPGLMLSSDGKLTGTPSGYGSFSFVVRVRDSQPIPDSDSNEVTVRILPADLNILTVTLPDGIEGVSYNQTLSASGGIPPYSWRLFSGAMPGGLTLSVAGSISGVPTNSAIGTSAFTLQVSDSQSQPATDQQAFAVNVSPASHLSITSTSPLPDGKVGAAYSFRFSAAGGKLPCIWRMTSGDLPDGLSLSSDGALTGSPIEYGDFVFSVEVADSQETPETVSHQFSLHISPSDLILLTSSLPDGLEGAFHSRQLEATGGVPPYTWEISAGALPDGLILDAAQGVIRGTPSNAAIGVSNFAVRVKDTQTPAATSERYFSITVLPSAELGITSISPLPDGKVGESYHYSFSASGGKQPYSWSLDSGLLPSGVTLFPNGELAGTPDRFGDFTFTIRVSDSQQPADAALKPFTLHVAPADLRILTLSLPNATEGLPYSESVEAAGGVRPYRWEIISGGLPDGLVLDAATGVIAGTPTNAAIGTSGFMVRVTDSQAVPAHDDRQLQITVTPAEPLAITTATPLDGKVGQPYSQTLEAKGGKRPYAWAITSGTLPTGLNLTSQGLLSGTPTEHGDFSFAVGVSDSQAPPETATRACGLHISPADLKIETVTLPDGPEGSAYEAVLVAAGGVPPLTWSVASGSLPNGLSLDSTRGIISGTPTNSAIGASSFTLRVTDSQSPARQDERALTIRIAPALELAITSRSPLPDAKAPVVYQYKFEASGGKLPYSWSVASGTSPTGLSLSKDGSLTGTPTQHGDYTFAVMVTDSQNPVDSATSQFSLDIAPEDLKISTLSLPDGKEGAAYQQKLEAKGGIPPYTWRVASGALPDGLRLDQATGVISGTPTNPAIGKSSFTVRVSDSESPAAQHERPFSIVVSPAADLQVASASPLPEARVGDTYSYSFSASGGKRPYAWSLISGAISAGVSLSSLGELSGVPSQPGDFVFVVRVTDSQEIRDSDEKQFAVHVAAREMELQVSALDLTFSTRRGGANPPSQTLTIRIVGTQQAAWRAVENCAWLSLNPTTGSNSGEDDVVAVSVEKTGLEIGTYEAEIDVIPTETPEKHEVVRVHLFVNPIRVPQEYATIQKGIDAAASDDTVLVSPGIYREKTTTKAGVKVVGSGADRTTIDAEGTGTVVAMLGGNSTVEGFTVRNGIGDYFGNGARVGGGVYCGAVSATIAKCRIVDNVAAQGWGGGVFVNSGCSITIVDSLISGNSAESGGGLFCHENSRATIQTSIVRDNTAAWYGGGVCGIDLSSVMLASCEVSRNSAGYSGGAIAAKERGAVTVVNCTLADNSADEAGGIFSESASSVSLANSLLWNEPTDLVMFGESTVQFCDIRDRSFAGQNHNFSLDPLFVNAAQGDYHLLPSSPCLDVGDNNVGGLPEKDMDGEPRVLLSYSKLATDIGADEVDVETVFAVMSPPVLLNGGGLVTVNYTLWNGRAAPSSVLPEYSTNGGTAWYGASRAVESEPIESLTTSADGEKHMFVWDSVADVGGRKISGVRVRIKPIAAKAHAPATSEEFSLDNSAADYDDDKLPDAWERQIIDADRSDSITSISHVLPGADFDGDGKTNRFEYQTSTSPIDPSSLFDVEFVAEADGRLRFRWTSAGGKIYAVYYCEALGDAWRQLCPAQLGTGGILECVDDVVSGRMRFYKVMVY